MLERSQHSIDELNTIGQHVLTTPTDPMLNVTREFDELGNKTFTVTPTYGLKRQEIASLLIRTTGYEEIPNRELAVERGLQKLTYPNSAAVNAAQRIGLGPILPMVRHDAIELYKAMRHSEPWQAIHALVPIYGELSSSGVVWDHIPEVPPSDFLQLASELRLNIDELEAMRLRKASDPVNPLFARQFLGKKSDKPGAGIIGSYLEIVKSRHGQRAVFDIERKYKDEIFIRFRLDQADRDDSPPGYLQIVYIPRAYVPQEIFEYSLEGVSVRLPHRQDHDIDYDGTKQQVTFRVPAPKTIVVPKVQWLRDVSENIHLQYQVDSPYYRGVDETLVYRSPGLGLALIAIVSCDPNLIRLNLDTIARRNPDRVPSHTPGLGMLALWHVKKFGVAEPLHEIISSNYFEAIEERISQDQKD